MLRKPLFTYFIGLIAGCLMCIGLYEINDDKPKDEPKYYELDVTLEGVEYLCDVKQDDDVLIWQSCWEK